MCGLGGVFGPARGDADGAALLAALRHRGPDDARLEQRAVGPDLALTLAFARLAVIDPSPGGRQPMTTEDGALTLLFNGEIYNHAALRAELVAAGVSFRARSDTEVVLRLLHAHGPAALSRLQGMFALALWDQARRELLLARDAMGIKPLYHAWDGTRFAFASEVRALLAARAVAPRLDPDAVAGFLALGAVPEPRTIVAGVQALPPGHLVRVRAQGDRLAPPELMRFAPPWRDPDGTRPPALAGIFARTVRAHLAADVPVAILLSGGVDSTAVAARAAAAATAPLASFTLRYGGTGPAEEDADRAAETARTLGLRHHDVLITPARAHAALPRFLAALDQPSVDGFNTFLVCEAVAAAGYKVALSGLGGDELFFGYGLHRRFVRARRAGAAVAPSGVLHALAWQALRAARALGVPERVRKAAGLARALLLPEPQRAAALYAQLRALLLPEEVAALVVSDARADKAHELVQSFKSDTPQSPWRQIRALERDNYLRATLLRDADALSMASGVELRVPLCDRALWDAVLAGPIEAGEGSARPGRPAKAPLVRAAGHPRVDAVAALPKRGFSLPIAAWLAGPLRPLAASLLGDADAARAAGLSPPALAALVPELSAPDPARAFRLWALLVLLSYTRRHGLRLS